MDPHSALHSIENNLRTLVKLAFPNESWREHDGILRLSVAEVRLAREAEQEVMTGVEASRHLLEYVDTGPLTAFVLENKDRFAQYFGGEVSLLTSYMRIIGATRNLIAHNRRPVQFQVDLLNGIAGHIAVVTSWAVQHGSETGLFYDGAQRSSPVLLAEFPQVAGSG